jgi:hypothetical protein
LIKFDEAYYEAKNRVFKREIASIIINTLDQHGGWVKDMDFVFMDISDRAADKLYGRHSNKCVGKTDIQILKEDNKEIDINLCTNICHFTDLYVKEHGDTDFIEIFQNSKGKMCLWKVYKGIKKYSGQEFYWGIAHFLEEIKGSYDNALTWLNNHLRHCIKLNDNVYIWDMKELG